MLARTRRQLFIPVAAFVSLAGAAVAQSQAISTDDGSSVLNFHTHPTLGIVLESVGDALDPQAMPLGELGLWQLEFHRGTACILIGPENLSSAEIDVDIDDDKVKVEWDNAQSALLSGESFNVEIEFEADKKTGEFEGTIHVKTKTPTSSLHRVRFPRLELIVDGNPASTRFAAPVEHGVLFVDPSHNVAVTGPAKLNAALKPCDAITLVEPGVLSMQWWSLYDEQDPTKANLFFGTKDKKGYRKEWLYEVVPPSLGTNRFRPVLRHVPEKNNSLNGDYKQSFPFVLKVIRGDWYDAARHYREWALTQPWTAQGPMAGNADFSAIMKNAEMLGVTQPPQAGPDDPATFCPLDPSWDKFAFWPAETASQDATFGVSRIVPRIFFWDFNSFGRDIGDWFPINPTFKNNANALRAQGDDYAAYFVSLGYSTRVPSYTQSYVPDSVNGGNYGPLEPWGLKNENQVRIINNNTACPPAPVIVPTLGICQATQFAADYSAYVARRLYDEAGARGLYLDVLTGSDVLLCYDTTHGHPVGGGFYYTQGLQHILETVRERMREDSTSPVPDYFLQSEGAGERFLPWLEVVHPQLTWTRTQTFCDVFTGQCPRNGTDFLVVPLYGTVYHDFQLTSATLQLAAPRNVLGPFGLPILQDPFFLRSLRNIFAAHVRLGYTPFAGSILSPDLTASNATAAFSPEYLRLTQTVNNFMSVLKLPTVRDFTTFGPRLRDPKVTRADAAESPITSVRFDLAPFTHSWLAYGRAQPFVYATIYGRGSGEAPVAAEAASGQDGENWGFGWDDDACEADFGDGYGAKGWDDVYSGAGGGGGGDELSAECPEAAPEEIGIFVMNWSDPSDNAFFLTTDAGPQTARITFDPEQYRPGADTYAIFLVGPTGETPFASGAITGLVKVDVTVPARTALFFRVELAELED